MTLGTAGSRSVEAAAHNWAAGSLRLPGLVLLPRSAAGGRRGHGARGEPCSTTPAIHVQQKHRNFLRETTGPPAVKGFTYD